MGAESLRVTLPTTAVSLAKVLIADREFQQRPTWSAPPTRSETQPSR